MRAARSVSAGSKAVPDIGGHIAPTCFAAARRWNLLEAYRCLDTRILRDGHKFTALEGRKLTFKEYARVADTHS